MKRRTLKNVLFMVLAVLGPGAAFAAESSFTFGFSGGLFTDVKKSDAIASINVWANTLLELKEIQINSAPLLFNDLAEVQTALLAGEVDMVSLLTGEFLHLETKTELDHLFFTATAGCIEEEYLLLVRKDRGLDSLASLKGKSIMLASGVRMGPGKVWIETLLMQEGAAGLSDYFESAQADSKVSRTVLGVFFGKTDACLINRRGYETMVELNPQVGRELSVLMTSPEFVPAVLCMRKAFESPQKIELLNALHELHAEVRGSQILNLFRADQLVAGTRQELATTREWLVLHDELKKELTGRVE